MNGADADLWAAPTGWRVAKPVAALAFLLLAGCRSAVPTPTLPPPEKLPEVPRIEKDEPVPSVPHSMTSTTLPPR